MGDSLLEWTWMWLLWLDPLLFSSIFMSVFLPGPPRSMLGMEDFFEPVNCIELYSLCWFFVTDLAKWFIYCDLIWVPPNKNLTFLRSTVAPLFFKKSSELSVWSFELVLPVVLLNLIKSEDCFRWWAADFWYSEFSTWCVLDNSSL